MRGDIENINFVKEASDSEYTLMSLVIPSYVRGSKPMLMKILIGVIILLLCSLAPYAQQSDSLFYLKGGKYHIYQVEHDGHRFFTSGVQSSGKVIVAGSYNQNFGDRVASIARLYSNGDMDTTFLMQGFANFVVDDSAGSQIWDIAIHKNDDIALIGTFANRQEAFSIFFMRMDKEGNVDEHIISGDDTGYVTIDVPFIPDYRESGSHNHTLPLYSYASKILIQDEHKYIILGNVNKNINEPEESPRADGASFAVRLLKDGSMDPSFGTNGWTFFNYSAQMDHITDAVMLEDNSIIILGNYNKLYNNDDINDGQQMFLTRIDRNGKVMKNFGDKGRLLISHNNEFIEAVKLLEVNDRIYIFSNYRNYVDERRDIAYNDILVACVDKNGSYISDFGDRGKKIINIMGYDVVRDVKLYDNKIVIVGNQYNKVGEYLKGYKDLSDSVTHYPFTASELDKNTYHIFAAFFDTDLEPIVYKDYLSEQFLSVEKFADDAIIYTCDITPDNCLFMAGQYLLNHESKFLVSNSLLKFDAGEMGGCEEKIAQTFFYPNPVADNAKLGFQLCQPSDISVSVHDIQGRRIFDVVNEVHFEKGSHAIPVHFPSATVNGNYIIVIRSAHIQKAIKVVYLKSY